MYMSLTILAADQPAEAQQNGRLAREDTIQMPACTVKMQGKAISSTE
jgi:hypothetical protein